MDSKPLFLNLDNCELVNFINSATAFVCLAAPGMGVEIARALVAVGQRLGPHAVSVTVDASEQALRMGYGAIDAINLLRDVGIRIENAANIRSAVLIVDHKGYCFWPVPLSLEPEIDKGATINALRMSDEQVKEATIRLWPPAKAIAKAMAKSEEEIDQIDSVESEIVARTLSENECAELNTVLDQNPVDDFDLRRRINVYTAHFQYCEIEMTGVALNRRKISIPRELKDELITEYGLQGKIHESFDLLPPDTVDTFEIISADMRAIRDRFAPALRGGEGRVILKCKKAQLERELTRVREKLKALQTEVELEIDRQIKTTFRNISDHYTDLILGMKNNKSDGQVRAMVDEHLNDLMPSASSLFEAAKIEHRYKDITIENLRDNTFAKRLLSVFPAYAKRQIHDEFVTVAPDIHWKSQNLW